MNFEESLSYLLGLGHETLTMKLGLRNTELLLEAVGNPHHSFASVQIAGTNGKGSTAAVLDAICRQAGIKTGLFTSPHLVSITERIVIDGQEIWPQTFAAQATIVRTAAEDLVSRGLLQALPTFFEHVTAIALLCFAEALVRLAILETGLGGRLDATTVAGAHSVAITQIALDHQEYLGETLAAIAAEKAAIIRPGVEAIIAPQYSSALEVILRRCEQCQVVPVIISDLEATTTSSTVDGKFCVNIKGNGDAYQHLQLGLRGRHQVSNTLVAVRLAESLRKRGFDIPEAAIIEGVRQVTHAGRLEIHEGRPPILLDGAHNPAGAQTLSQYLNEFVSGPITLVFGAMNDKKVRDIAAVVFPLADRLVLTQAENPRSASVSDLLQLAAEFLSDEKVRSASSAFEALERAKAITPANGLICVSGSLYLVGEMKQIMAASSDSNERA